MARYPWFRMYYEARTDAKLHSLPDDQFRVWFNLLCFAAEQDEQRGSIDISDQFIVALEVAGGDEELLSRTCHALSRLKIVTYDEVTLTFINFKPRQYDKPSDEPEKTRERKRKSRETTRDSGTSRRVSRDVTPRHAQDTDTERDKSDANASERKAPAIKSVEDLPRNGPAQTLVAEWYRRVGSVPASYRKAVGQAQSLVTAGVDVPELMLIYDHLAADSFWASGFDLGIALSQLDKIRQSRRSKRKSDYVSAG